MYTECLFFMISECRETTMRMKKINIKTKKKTFYNNTNLYTITFFHKIKFISLILLPLEVLFKTLFYTILQKQCNNVSFILLN